MKTPVNPKWLMYTWNPIGEGQDTAKVRFLDMDNEHNIAILADEYLYEYFKIMDHALRMTLNVNWQYAIEMYSEEDLKYGLDAVLPQINFP